MAPQIPTSRQLFLCHQGGNSLAQARVAMTEVRICGIPKQDKQEVDSAP